MATLENRTAAAIRRAHRETFAAKYAAQHPVGAVIFRAAVMRAVAAQSAAIEAMARVNRGATT